MIINRSGGKVVRTLERSQSIDFSGKMELDKNTKVTNCTVTITTNLNFLISIFNIKMVKIMIMKDDLVKHRPDPRQKFSQELIARQADSAKETNLGYSIKFNCLYFGFFACNEQTC